jgi:hypothetical protein
MVGCSYKTARLAIKRHQIPVIPYGVRRALRARLEAQREGVRARELLYRLPVALPRAALVDLRD